MSNEYLMSRGARDLRTALNDLRSLMSADEADQLRNRLGDLVAPLEEAERREHQSEARKWVEQMLGYDNAGN